MLRLVVFTAVVAAVIVDGQEYTSRWDTVDIDRILKNERLMKTYFKCVMDQGKCSPDAVELKKNIPEALENACAKCTEKQKENVDKVMKHLYHKKPDMFKQLEEKYDPKRIYRENFNEEAKKRGILV